MRIAWLLLVVLVLVAASGCASVKQNSAATMQTTRSGLGDAMLAPLEDVNLRREPIPIVLRALRGPYPPRDPEDCEGIAAHVRDLTAVLGPDADRRTEEGGRIGAFAGEEALDVVAGTATDFIPFRSVVRFATGATAHDKKVRRAYRNGTSRRAYLKGLGQAMGCGGVAVPARGD